MNLIDWVILRVLPMCALSFIIIGPVVAGIIAGLRDK